MTSVQLINANGESRASYLYVNDKPAIENMITTVIRLVLKSGNILEPTMRQKAASLIKTGIGHYTYHNDQTNESIVCKINQ